ncbi:uncharacterized protein LOC106673148 isoform X7 [Cimex lectularius]|uniref:Uncharacterized protein n=1 Tax=Cimex lectularius TaxID=79782 RepID=A0A8I6SNV7_CIMLE|nr:uncharacterized protein LOC106673148 isoform X7 [Cimex lectularius]
MMQHPAPWLALPWGIALPLPPHQLLPPPPPLPHHPHPAFIHIANPHHRQVSAALRPLNVNDEVCLVAPAPVVIGKRSTHEDLDPNRELKKVRFCLTDRQFGKTSFRLFLR